MVRRPGPGAGRLRWAADGEAGRERARQLWDPVDDEKDYGARGAFDDRSEDRSRYFWASRHRGVIGAVGLGLATGAAALLFRGLRDD